jgi:Uma2 family endonuclease
MAEVVAKKVSVKEFREMDFPDDNLFIYELINGEIMRKQAPKPLHQQIAWRLTSAIDKFLSEKPIGKGFFAPIDVYFDDYNNAQPDLIFIANERSFIIDLHEGIMGAPDLIVEIISPSSVKQDRFDKKEMYEKFAVKEYWIIDPRNETLEIYVFKDNVYKLHQFIEINGVINSTILEGFDIDFKHIITPL